jgi:hypothetical protein
VISTRLGRSSPAVGGERFGDRTIMFSRLAGLPW